MTNDEYMAAQNALLMSANLLQGHDLAAFLRRVDQAEAVAPIVDPTLYRRAGQRLAGTRELARAGLAFQAAAAALRGVVAGEASRG